MANEVNPNNQNNPNLSGGLKTTYATKRMSFETTQRRSRLLPAVIALLVGAVFMQTRIDPDAKQYKTGEKSIGAMGGLNNEFLLLPLLGFREAAAGLLWVRCDEFFHSGDYDAILPLVRMITLLDPHADNVYVTGAWHLAYNFTDSSERSDWRYVGPAQQLLDEGIANNMNIPDIKFEKGWQNYDKIKDYAVAAKAFEMAIAGPNSDEKAVNKDSDDYPYAAPLKTLHILAHCYEREGRIPEALAEWRKARARTEHDIEINNKTKKQPDFSLNQMLSTEKHNYEETYQRYYNRYTTGHHDKVNPTNIPDVLRPPVVSKDQTPRPWDVALKTRIDVVRPHVLKISGLFNTLDGSRINVWISNEDYKPKGLGESLNSFEVVQDTTVLHDSISVRQQKYSREMDMSKDPKMYAFLSKSYKIVLDYNVRGSSPHLLDRFGWNGEGLTDSTPGHLVTDKRPEVMGTTMIKGQDGEEPVWDGTTIPFNKFGQPLRITRVTYKVSNDQMKGVKPITDADIVPNE